MSSHDQQTAFSEHVNDLYCIIDRISSDMTAREKRRATFHQLPAQEKKNFSYVTTTELEHEKQLVDWMKRYCQLDFNGAQYEGISIKRALKLAGHATDAELSGHLTACKSLVTQIGKALVESTQTQEFGTRTPASIPATLLASYEKQYAHEHAQATLRAQPPETSRAIGR